MRSLLTAIAVQVGAFLAASSGAAQPGDDVAETDAAGESYRAHLAAALASHRLGEHADARRWLDGAPTSQRGWEWKHLAALFDQSNVAAEGMPAGIYSVAAHPGGKMAALGLGNGSIVLWDLENNSKRGELAGHKGAAFCVRFSTDGTKLVTSGVDRIARVWDIARMEAVVEFKEHKFPVAAVTFTADGKFIASAAYYTDKETPIEGRVHLWDAATGEIVRTYKGGVKPISSIALSPDGRRLAAGSWDSCVFVWDVESGGEPRRFGEALASHQSLRISSIGFSPDGTLLAAGSDHDWAKVYRVDDGETVATLTDHRSDVNAVAFSPNGGTLATGGDDGAIRLWNATDWTSKSTLCGHTGPVTSLAWNTDGALISVSADKSLRSWDATRKDYGGVRATIGAANYSTGFSSDGRLLACSTSNGTVALVDARTGQVVSQWVAHEDNQTCTATISPDGRMIASCSWDKTVRLFDIQTQAETLKIELPAGVAYVTWQPSGELLAAALTNGTAVLIDAMSGEIVRSLAGHARTVLSVAFSPDGSRLTTASADGTARIWNVESGDTVVELRGHAAKLESSTFTHDGLNVVTGSDDGSVRLWDATTGELIRILLSGGDPIYRVAVSPDGKRIGAVGKHLYLLDPSTSGAVLKSKPLVETMWHLGWSPDGRRLAVASWDGRIAVFDSEPPSYHEE